MKSYVPTLLGLLLIVGIFFLLRSMVPRYDNRSVPVDPRERWGPEVSSIEGKVVKIKDGDSVVLLKGEDDFTVIRLQHIDAPENGQPFSEEAWKHLSKLCRNKEVAVKVSDEQDRYNRMIGEIYLPNGTNVNKEMVRAGYAWHFAKYSNDQEYTDLQDYAKQRRKGLWAEVNPIPPHEWRESQETKPVQ